MKRSTPEIAPRSEGSSHFGRLSERQGLPKHKRVPEQFILLFHLPLLRIVEWFPLRPRSRLVMTFLYILAAAFLPVARAPPPAFPTFTYDPNNPDTLPQTWQPGQVGTNRCGGGDSPTSMCQVSHDISTAGFEIECPSSRTLSSTASPISVFMLHHTLTGKTRP